MIDILVPVLGRPQNAQPLVDNIRAVTTVPHTIIFICTGSDDAQREACIDSGADLVHIVDWPAGPADYAKKINRGLSFGTDSDWVFTGADDITFEPNWDINALRENTDVVATNDMHNSQVKRGMFGTHNLVRRRYVTKLGATGDSVPGVLLHEGYDHNYVDRELCGVAQHRGRYAFARHSIVRHRHPLWRTAPHDMTYKKSLRHASQDQQLFFSRAHLWDYAGLSEHERKMAA